MNLRYMIVNSKNNWPNSHWVRISRYIEALCLLSDSTFCKYWLGAIWKQACYVWGILHTYRACGLWLFGLCSMIYRKREGLHCSFCNQTLWAFNFQTVWEGYVNPLRIPGTTNLFIYRKHGKTSIADKR